MENQLTPGELIREMRLKNGWTQKKLGELIGVRQNRISKLEKGQRPVSETEWQQLSPYLESQDDLPTRRKLPYPAELWRVRPPEAYLQGDVTLSSRVNRARKTFGNIVDRCLRAIYKRDDAPLSIKFLNDACLDSGDEGMLWLLGLAGEGRACWYALSKAGFRRHRVVDAALKKTISDIRRPCLEINRDKYAVLMFPQVRLQTARAWYRLDALCCVRKGNKRCWINVEVDGPGHDPESDGPRQRHIGLPTLRYTRADLKRQDFLETMERHLLDVLAANSEPQDSVS